MFILVLALVVGSVIAADNIFTVGADYSVLAYGDTGGKQHFAGGEVALYSYANEFSDDGFMVQGSAQYLTSMSIEFGGSTVTVDVQGNKTLLVSILGGYARRFPLGGTIDLTLGVGPTYQLLSDDGETQWSTLGLGANIEALVMVTPTISVHVGFGTSYNFFDLKAQKTIDADSIPITVRPYIAAGFRF